jgi:putative transposase
MLVRYRFRVYPSVPQGRLLAKTFGCVRYVYNRALALRKDAYAENKTKISYAQTSAALTQWKRETGLAWLREVSCVPLQQCLRHLQSAYNGFFAKRAAYPRFKSKRGNQSAEFTRSAFKWDGKQLNLALAKIGHLRIRWSRQFASTPSTVTIIKDCAGRYFATLCLDETVGPMPKTGKNVGIDLGTYNLATLSTGESISNPKFLARRLAHLAKLQRTLARRKKGSGRWHRQRIDVARLHAHVADSRSDYLAKVTTGLVRRFDLVCIEDLDVGGMMVGRHQSRLIADVGMHAFRQMLTYKCRWYGKELQVVDRFFPSSKRCSKCHHVLESLPLSVREWTCPCCGTIHDRELNAANNILSAGQAASARGGRVRPKVTRVTFGGARRSVNQPALP